MNPFSIDTTPSEQRTLLQVERAMRDAKPWMTDPAMLRMAHPVRVAATPAMAPEVMAMLMSTSPNFILESLRIGKATVDLFIELETRGDVRARNFYSMHSDLRELGSQFGCGAAGATVHAMRFAVNHGKIYSLSNQLTNMLRQTHLGTDIPVSAIELPVPNLYIELGSTRDNTDLQLVNHLSGQHALEGAYISQVRRASGEMGIEITLTGSPVGKSELMDDAVEWYFMPADGSTSVSDALLRCYKTGLTADGEVPISIGGDNADILANDALSKLELALKALLFLNMTDAQLIEVKEGTEARRALARAQSGAHRRKAAKAVARSYDRVVVDVPVSHDEEIGKGEKSFHFRDGHLRHQRHGPANALVKLIWIRPVAVRADRMV